MSPGTMDYLALLRKFNDKGLNYLVAGGLAVNLHGVPRMTFDLDILVLLTTENLRKALDLLAELGYRPRLPVDPSGLLDSEIRREWKERRGLLAFTFWNDREPVREVDILVDEPAPFDELANRADILDLDGLSVPVLGLADLIDVKRQAGRRQDLADAEMLERLLRPED